MHVAPVAVEDISVDADNLNIEQAAAIYEEHGCLIVRGMMRGYVHQVREEVEHRYQVALANYDNATKVREGWTTPDGTLWLPAPEGFDRERQVMCLNLSYKNSGSFFMSGLHKPTLDLAEAVLGPDVELFGAGQSLYKEPCGGHPKMLHQDGAYFEHKHQGPMAMLTYCADTPVERGALHVIPGSHKLGILNHIDTFSHLGLDLNDWPWESATPVEGKAGDSIFFQVKTIHGSKPNYTEKGRPIFIHRYRAADDYTTINATTAENREKAEHLQEDIKEENQQGFMVRGYRKG